MMIFAVVVSACPKLGHKRKEIVRMQNEYTEYVLKKGQSVIITSRNYEDVKNLQFLRGGEIHKIKVTEE